MATTYFKLEQIATVGSPTTGSTAYMAWPDTAIPAGLNRAFTINHLVSNPNTTWSFRSRYWKVTNLGSATIPFDTQMVTGEYWNKVSDTSVAVYIGSTFNINTTFFAQNYIDVLGPSGTFKSPRYSTDFYSANTFNDLSKVIGTDNNRYDFIFLTSVNDYSHITNFGVLNYDFNNASSITSDLVSGLGSYHTQIPYFATNARNYFNGLYDGWVTMSDDCYGNLITDSSGVQYSGDMRDRVESYSSIWGGPCLKPNNLQQPYSGVLGVNYYDIVLNWYSDCSDCISNNPFNNIYKFQTGADCTGVATGGQVFSASTLTWGNPLGNGFITPQFVESKFSCFGGETDKVDQVLIGTALTGGHEITGVYENCTDCQNNFSELDEYYYFSACSGNKVFRFNSIDFINDLNNNQTPSINETFLFENVGGVNGCYTMINEPLTPYVIITYWDNSVASVGDIRCDNILCTDVTPTPTPTNTTTPTVTPTLSPFVPPSYTPTSTPTVTPTVTPTSSPFVPPSYTPTSTPTPTPTPSSNNGTGCFSGITDGFYTFTDCCGRLQQGNEVGLEVCVDTGVPMQGVQISGDVCVVVCDEGPITYSFGVTGTCVNPKGGFIIINPSGGTKPYTVQNTSTTAAGGLLLGQQSGNGPFGWGGVEEGSYVFLLQDSSGGVNQDVVININVEGCFNATITSSGTTCGDVNGVVTVTNDSLSSPFQYDLYNIVSSSIFQSFNSLTNTHTFTNIGPGTYYSIVTDFGGATAQTTNTTVVSTDPISYNILVVPDSPCGPGVGTATVTNLLGGTPPYSYLWSNGQTTQTATGLSVGSWSVTVTDSEGCRLSQSINVGLADPLGIVSTVPTQAGCFDCDGQVVVTISGGTSPYTYQNSAGEVITSNNLSESFTGLCGGFNSTIITDAGDCKVTAFESIPSSAGFTIVNIGVTNSDCNDDGSISISISAPAGIFTYEVTNGLITDSTTTSSQSHTFNNLPSGTYTVTIVSQNGNCTYSTDKTISNNVKFNVNSIITDGTCGDNNGIIDINLTAGSVSLEGPFDYILTDVNTGSVVYSVIDDPSNTQSITSLSPSTYLLNVTDAKNCTVFQTITIAPSTGLNFIIIPTECVSGNDGMADISISEGVAPFYIQWSNGETTMSITGLSGDTYTATITDNNGCSATESVTINCNNQIVECYEVNEICENDFITTSAGIRDFGSMLNEGYLDLTVGHQNCTLVNAVFYAIVDFSGGTMTPPYHIENPFYTGTNLGDYPSAQEWRDAIDEILKTIPQIESVILDIDQNLITIISDCKELKDVYFRLSTKIVYDICCNDIPTPTPTPTNTSTPTPTPTEQVVVIDDETEINIFFDDSGSMGGTEGPLNIMADTILKDCLLPFYNNDSALYDSRVRVINFDNDTRIGSNPPWPPPYIGSERGYACLATTGTTSSITKVINLVFQDEASGVYANSSASWSNTTSRTSGYNFDMALLRSNIDNNPANYILGEYFQVTAVGNQIQAGINFKQLLEAVDDGLGLYNGVNGLSDKTEISNTYDVVPGPSIPVSSGPGSPQYYTDLIITAINNLGYNIPPCNQTPTPTPTVTPTITPTQSSSGYNSLGLFFGLHGGGSSQPCNSFNGGGVPNIEYFTDVSVLTFLNCPTGNSVYAFSGGNYVLIGNGAFVSNTGCIFNMSGGVVTSTSPCVGGDCSGIGSGC